MMTFGLVIAFIAAIWVYSDARGRGYASLPAILWSLGTFLLLIVVLPLYLLIGRRQQPAAPRRRESPIIDVEASVVEDMINCPMCGRQVKEDFNVCPYCGYSLRPKCASCGSEVRREWQTCPNCQAPRNWK